jgi:hypothetical protein
MRKVSAEERQQIIKYLRQGGKVKDVCQKYNLPVSTIRTWMAKDCPELKKRFYDETIPVEARIFTMFCPYLKPDVKDSVYEKLQQSLQNELNDFAITINQRFSTQEEDT